MRRGFFIILLLVGSFFLFSQQINAEDCATSTGWSFLKINAFSSYSSSDWVEIFNTSPDKCVSLQSLDLVDSSSVIKELSQDTNVQPKNWYLVDVGNRLNQKVDTVGLKPHELVEDANLDKIEYGTDVFPYSLENEVCARKNDGVGGSNFVDWATSTVADWEQRVASRHTVENPPPEEINENKSEKFAQQEIQINEVMYNPLDGEEEWVELFNNSTSSVDLSDSILCDSRENDCEIAAPTSTIVARGFLVVYIVGSKLNNDGDKVILKNSEGQVKDVLQYGEALLGDKGQSIVRDGGGAWTITTHPTPGEENEIVLPLNTTESVNSGGSSTAIAPTTISEVKKKTATSNTTSTSKIKEEAVGVIWKVVAPTQGSPGENLDFDASESADPRGGKLIFGWNFGDNSEADGERATHAYTTSGTYAVVVSATSTAGTVGQKKINLKIGELLSAKKSKVVISEVCPNHLGSDRGEFIEIYNSSSSTVDISGWKLEYKEKQYTIPKNTLIHNGELLVFYQAATKFSLNNSGGEVLLLSPDEVVVSKAVFPIAKDGHSFNFIDDKMIESVANPAQVFVTSSIVNGNVTTAKAKVLPSKTKKKVTSKSAYAGAVTIAAAHEVTKNTGVKVMGTVTALPGTYGVQYFYISDGEAGIQVYQYKKQFPVLKVGDRVQVKGTITQSGEIKRIKVTRSNDIQVLPDAGQAIPVDVAIEELDAENAGSLVKISGEITEIKSNYMYVDDGSTEATVYFKKGAKIDKQQFKEGELVEVTGVVENIKNVFQVWPRNQEDIKVIGKSEDLIKKEAGTQPSAGSDTAEKYLTATAGGITTLLLGLLVKLRGGVVGSMAKRGGLLLVGLVKHKKDQG